MVLSMIFCTSTALGAAGLSAMNENGNLAGADVVLETIFGGGADARVISIQGGDFRHALHACVTGNQCVHKRMLSLYLTILLILQL